MYSTLIKPSWRLLLALVLTFTVVGCDSNDDDDNGAGEDPAAIHGAWRSAGENVAPGLAELGFDDIRATFNADGTYTVHSMFGEIPVTQTGTYTTAASSSGSIRTIELEQHEPNTLESRGIYEIDGNTMRYEVVDVSQGTPPTPEGGFGSTVAGDDPAGHWTQTFVRIEGED